MATIMQPFHCDLRPRIQDTNRTTHTGTTTRCRTQRRNTFASGTTPVTPAAHTRYLSSPAATTLHGKIQGFVLRLPPQNKTHATFMQPLQCVLQHDVANPHASTHMATPHDNNHAAIPMRSATTTDSRNAKNYAHRNNHSLQNIEEERIDLETIQTAPAAHRRCLSSPAAATLHGKIQGFVLRLPPQNKAPCNIHAGQFFCDVLLCSVKSHTTLHQGQIFCDVLLCSLKSHTTLHQGQFFCDVLLCSAKSHTALHQGQFFCDVLLCSAKSHTTLHQGQVSQFYLSITRKYCFPTSFDNYIYIYIHI